MFKENFFFFCLLFLLVIIQSGLLSFFRFSWLFNLPLIFFVWWLVFKRNKLLIYPAVLWTGFWLDIFSASFLGASVPILFLEVFFLDKILENFKKQNFLFFLIFAFPFVLVYHSYFLLINWLLNRF